jgi:signal transduction histidine kinase
MPYISPYLDLVTQILADVATSYDADFSTLFRVSDDRSLLRLEAGYGPKGKVEISGTEPYKLEWPDPNLDQRMHHGVTCWVAEHGEPLFVPNLQELRRHRAYAGKGAWDGKLFENPQGVDHPKMGFGCFYAVPLRVGTGQPRNTVIGVFKIERRRNKAVFDEHERKAFDLAAASISRTLQMYLSFAITLRRVLSEAAHILRGRLSDSLSVIEMCRGLLAQSPPQVEYAQTHLPGAESLLRAGVRRIERVLEAYRGEQFATDFMLKDVVYSALEAGFADLGRCKIIWDTPAKPTIHLTSIQRYDLETVLLNLLRNADQHAGTIEPVQLRVRTSSDPPIVEFQVADRGAGIQKEVVDRARAAAASGAQEEVLLLVRGGGTGLRRVFRFAAEYGWIVVHDYPPTGGTTFTVTVPNQMGRRTS